MLLRIFSIFILFLTSTSTYAQGFTVNKFNVDITLNKEGYFDVVENYELYFSIPKHGIYREILTDYNLQSSDGEINKRKLIIKNIEVIGHPYTVNSGYEQRRIGKVIIRIGDKNKYIRDFQHYEIKYRVYNAFLFDKDQVDFYWNIKPNGWLATFKKINFTIHVPDNYPLSAGNCFAYAGNTGTIIPSDEFDYSYTDGTFTGKSHENFYSVMGQDMTVLVKLPKTLIAENIITIPFWKEYLWVGIIIFLLLAFWIVWLKYGKDERTIAAISYYPPEGIDPAMAGYLINDKEDTSDLIALIPHWAAQGFISIKEIPKSGIFGTADMKLTRHKTLPNTSPKYEQKMFNGLFVGGATTLVSSLKNTFYITMNDAKKTLKKTAQEYYISKSNKVMIISIWVAVLLTILMFILFGLFFGPFAAISGLLTGIFMGFMSFYMKKKNKEGNVIYSELRGFKQFIKMAEVNRIKTLLEQDSKYFEKTMSYALAFGLLDKWADKFDALNISPPNWYSSSGATLVGMSAFSRSFSNSISSAQSNMISSPSSSGGGSSFGGGSSGGGFGGGGGGSW